MTMPLAEMAVDVLTTTQARQKADKSRAYARQWLDGRATGSLPEIGTAKPPARPARPDRPALLNPRDVPRRRPGSEKGRLALMHAIAHIELNAVDLHWDIIARFGATPMPPGYYDDWAKAAGEEAKHFLLIDDWLHNQGSGYGDLPAVACRHVARRRGYSRRFHGTSGGCAHGAGSAWAGRDPEHDRGV